MKTTTDSAGRHLLMAFGVWFCYGVLLAITCWRGLPPRKLAIATVVLFILSLMIFIVL